MQLMFRSNWCKNVFYCNLDEDGNTLLTDLEEYMDKDSNMEDEDLVYGFPDIQKR